MSKILRDDEAKTTLVGQLTSLSGVFLISDVREIDERWQAGPGSGAWVVDITGDDPNEVRYLAGRDGVAHELLPDGTRRILCTDQQQAQIIRDSIQICSGQRGAKGITTSVKAKGASALRAKDATRERGIGAVGDRMVGLISAGPLDVYEVRDGADHLIEIRLVPGRPKK